MPDVPNDREEDCGRKEDQCIDGTAGSSRTGESDGTKNKSNFHKDYLGNEYKVEGYFTKACSTLSMGCDMIQVGNKAKSFFLPIMAETDKYFLDDCIRIIENQPSPFPWLAVLAPKDKVMVLHGIWQFMAPFED